jgi:hypothetical protein
MKIPVSKILLSLLFLLTVLLSYAQDNPNPPVEFKNAPVLFKENGRSLQQVIVSCKADQAGTILVSEGPKELLKAELKKGNNSFLITLPAVQKTRNTNFTAVVNGSTSKRVLPLKLTDSKSGLPKGASR